MTRRPSRLPSRLKMRLAPTGRNGGAPDTQKGETLETWAKPEIWTDAAGFNAAGEDFYAKFVAVKEIDRRGELQGGLPRTRQGLRGMPREIPPREGVAADTSIEDELLGIVALIILMGAALAWVLERAAADDPGRWCRPISPTSPMVTVMYNIGGCISCHKPSPPMPPAWTPRCRAAAHRSRHRSARSIRPI